MGFLAYIITALVAFSSYANATIKVAVIDTGINKKVFKKKDAFCDEGHKDFTGTSIYDSHGHGTNVSGLIHSYAKHHDYCQVIIKYFVPGKERGNVLNMTKAIKHAIKIDVDIINVSGGGVHPITEEKKAVKRALDKGIRFVAAAGNQGTKLELVPYYPASYFSDSIVVGSTDGVVRLPSSNYGSAIDRMENGRYAVGDYGQSMTGTSQATAIATGKEVGRMIQDLRKFIINHGEY